jgi:hypothetical protein
MAMKSQEPGPGYESDQGTPEDMSAACDQAAHASMAHCEDMAGNVVMKMTPPA